MYIYINTYYVYILCIYTYIYIHIYIYIYMHIAYIYARIPYCKSYHYSLMIIVKMVFIKNCKIKNFDKQEKIN